MRHRSMIVFVLIAVAIVISIFTLNSYYNAIKEDIKHRLYTHHLQEVNELIEKFAGKLPKNDLVTVLQKKPVLLDQLNSFIELLTGSKYKHFFVVTKDERGFVILLDGGKEHFLEPFEPMDSKVWEQVYSSQRAKVLQEDLKGVWYTYLKPIVADGKTVALVTVDFAIDEQKMIIEILHRFDAVLHSFQIFGLFLFALVVVMIVLDRKRFLQLQQQSAQIAKMNEELQERIRQEVQKSRQKDKQLLLQSRLAQMGEMINMIAHQWRQPLSAISGLTTTLSLKAEMGKMDRIELLESTKKISDITQYLSKTIEDFRNFYKTNKYKEETSLDKIVQDTVGLVKNEIESKGVQLRLDLNAPQKIKTYSNELKQVLLNLIKNALDVIEERKIERGVIIILTEPNKIVVKDNAGGVPKEFIDKVFDPYFSTKRKNGTGIGLYMSKTIVDKHCKGELSLYNDSEGAVFEIKLPKESDEAS